MQQIVEGVFLLLTFSIVATTGVVIYALHTWERIARGTSESVVQEQKLSRAIQEQKLRTAWDVERLWKRELDRKFPRWPRYLRRGRRTVEL